jgi:HEAT repeat protein
MKIEKYKKYGLADLRRLENEHDVEGLIEALRAPPVAGSVQLQTAVIKGLRNIGAPESAPAVSALLDLDHPEAVRASAARALGPMGSNVALPALRSAVSDPSKKVQKWAMRSLGELRDRECLDALIDGLQNEDWGIRSYAAGALGEIGDQRATDSLIAILRDSHRTVRLSVIRALVELRDPRAIEALRSARDTSSLFRRRPYSDGLCDLEQLL